MSKSGRRAGLGHGEQLLADRQENRPREPQYESKPDFTESPRKLFIDGHPLCSLREIASAVLLWARSGRIIAMIGAIVNAAKAEPFVVVWIRS